jgi:acetoacetyl-CoA synthetase
MTVKNVPELPVTHSGKRAEAAARDAVIGVTVRNEAALRNPECLEAIGAAMRVQSGQRPDSPTGESVSTLESLLTGLWEEVFGFSPIGPQDDFFELGGHSLHAASLITKIRTLTGCNVPIASFLHAPTIERLAQVMQAGEADTSSSLVILREGNRERPLFIAHSLAGTVFELWALAREMDCHCAVYGIQGRGLREGEVPNSRVEDMAADYVEQIRSVQPHGPYALAGFSLGGLIAFEMAQQLLQCGEKVELVALVDSQLDEQCLTFPAWLAQQRSRVALELREIRGRSWRQGVSYVFSKATQIADRLRIVAGKAPKRSGLNEYSLGELTLPPNLRRIIVGLRVAMAAYRPKPYAGKVTYFQSTIRNPRWANPLGVWKRACQGEFEVVVIAGAHNDLLLPPMVAYVAHVLDRLLDVKNPRLGSELQRKPNVGDECTQDLSQCSAGMPQ